MHDKNRPLANRRFRVGRFTKQRPRTSYHDPTLQIRFLSHNSSYHMRCVVWSKSFARIWQTPHNQPTNSTSFTNSLLLPLSKLQFHSNPSFLTRSTCPELSQPSFSPDELDKNQFHFSTSLQLQYNVDIL